jgi:hypothetical protein
VAPVEELQEPSEEARRVCGRQFVMQFVTSRFRREVTSCRQFVHAVCSLYGRPLSESPRLFSLRYDWMNLTVSASSPSTTIMRSPMVAPA